VPAAGRLLRALAIAAAATWVFWPALRGSWLWDDDLEVMHNPWVRDAGGWWKAWVSPIGLDYFPLKDSLRWLEWQAWGAHVTGYHVVNLALHILSAWLLWRLLTRLGVAQAWVGGLLFAVHPLAVESVAWIAEFKNAVSLPPLLLAVTAWLDYDAGRRSRDYGAAIGWFAAAMLCKTSVVMLPCFLWVFAAWRRRRIGWTTARATLPFIAISLGLGLVTLRFQGHRAMQDVAPALGLAARFDQAGWSLLAYLRAMAFPVGLSPVYEPWVSGSAAWLPWGGLALVVGWAWIRRAGWGGAVLLAGGWILLNLLPVLGLIPLSYLRVAPRADHLAYIALAGACGLAAAGFSVLWAGAAAARTPSTGAGRRIPAGARASRAARAVLAALATAVVIALALGARGEAALFRDPATLWRETVARSPRAWLAHSNLGRVELEAGEAEAARDEFAAALALQPDSAEARANLGHALEVLGRPGEARAQYESAVAANPRFPGAHYDLGRSLLQSGRPAEAVGELAAAIRLDPGSAPAHNNLGLALAQTGHLDQAMAEYREALRLDPQRPEVQLNLGNAYVRLNRFDDAVAAYRAALALSPRYGAAHRNLATVLGALGREAEARTELEAARAEGVR
jgi:tetratricopeptide (TPR) repeat protein